MDTRDNRDTRFILSRAEHLVPPSLRRESSHRAILLHHSVPLSNLVYQITHSFSNHEVIEQYGLKTSTKGLLLLVKSILILPNSLFF